MITDGDYRLKIGSPAIDDPGILLLVFFDLDSQFVNLDGDADGSSFPDRGAYEFLNPSSDSDQDGFTDGFEQGLFGTALGLSPPSISDSEIVLADGSVSLEVWLEFQIEYSAILGVVLETQEPVVFDMGAGQSRITLRPPGMAAPSDSKQNFFRVRMDEIQPE